MLYLTGTDFPFQTSNAALALALYGAGIPFHDPKAPLTNTYDAGTLKSMGYKGSVEAAMLDAFASGRKGHVEYGFRQTLEQPDAVKAFNRIRARVESGEDTGRIFLSLQHDLAAGIVSQVQALASAVHLIVLRWREEIGQWVLLPGFQIQRRQIARRDFDGAQLIRQAFLLNGFGEFAATVMDVRRAFLDLYKQVKPLVRLHRLGSPAGISERRVRMPGFLYHCHDTPNGVRRDLGVATR